MAGKNKGPRIIKRKETEYERKQNFFKRSKGLLKKAFELSVLCDIDVALIMYSPTGELRHFSNNKKPERILQDYIQSLATNPETNPKNKEERRPVISKDTVDKINICASQADIENQEGLEAPKGEETNEEIRQYQNKLVLLQEQAKKLYPDQRISNSIQECMERKRYLGEVIYKIMERKNQLLSRFNISPPNTQVTQEAPLEVDPSLPTLEVQQWVDCKQYEVDLKGHQYPPMAHDHEASGSQSQVFEQTVHSQLIPMQHPQAREQVQLGDTEAMDSLMIRDYQEYMASVMR